MPPIPTSATLGALPTVCTDLAGESDRRPARARS
jgi:hypothetical protein